MGNKPNLRNKSEEYWMNKLTPEQFRVCRLKGTEVPFSGKYNKHYQKGMYTCVACGTPVFSSETKYDSGSGWPSFNDFVYRDNVVSKDDNTQGMKRTEIACAVCGSHLGHVFDDGPEKIRGKPATGLRYCINSTAINFIESKT